MNAAIPSPGNCKFAKNPAALAWLWKTNTGWPNPAKSPASRGGLRVHYPSPNARLYSSYGSFRQNSHCLLANPEGLRRRRAFLVELADWSRMLTGTEAPERLTSDLRPRAQGDVQWRVGAAIPTRNFFRNFIPKLGALRSRLLPRACGLDEAGPA